MKNISESGQTIGKGGFGKCKVKFSKKFNRKVVEKKLCLESCFRASICKNDMLLGFFKDVFEKENKKKYDQNHKVLKNEAKILKKLKFTRMKCCVEILDYIDNPPTIIMEFCEGGDLRKLIDSGNIQINDRIEIISQILEGLKKIHKAGIIHGDLKSLNIFLANKYEQNRMKSNIVKLGDFGLSGQNLIHGGTPGFMAPEIMKTGGSFESDIYSIGKVILEIITCLPLRNIVSINYNNLSNYIKYIPKFLGSDELVNIVKKCLNEDPKERPNAKELNKLFITNVLSKFNEDYEREITLINENKKKNKNIFNNLKENQRKLVNCHEHPLTLIKMKNEKLGWVCDICFEVFSNKKLGFNCQTCEEYNICVSCFEKFKIEKIKEKELNNINDGKKYGLSVIRESEGEANSDMENLRKSKNTEEISVNNIPVKIIGNQSQKRIKNNKNGENNKCSFIKVIVIIFIFIFSLVLLYGLYNLIYTINDFIKSKK